MKPLVLLLALAFVCLAAEPAKIQTRRVVNGKTVDLKPIYEWKKLRAAIGHNNPKLPPRPMPHWEDIAANRFEGSNEVLVKRGDPRTFLIIKNLPPPMYELDKSFV